MRVAVQGIRCPRKFSDRAVWRTLPSLKPLKSLESAILKNLSHIQTAELQYIVAHIGCIYWHFFWWVYREPTRNVSEKIKILFRETLGFLWRACNLESRLEPAKSISSHCGLPQAFTSASVHIERNSLAEAIGMAEKHHRCSEAKTKSWYDTLWKPMVNLKWPHLYSLKPSELAGA